MPLYEYECEACGHRFERIQKFSDPLVDVCPSCGKKKVHKLVSSPAIQFKGSGFYINDYARKGATGAEPPTSTVEPAKPAKTAASPANDNKSAAPAAASSTTPASTSGTKD